MSPAGGLTPFAFFLLGFRVSGFPRLFFFLCFSFLFHVRAFDPSSSASTASGVALAIALLLADPFQFWGF
jgi:hypothetical protein